MRQTTMAKPNEVVRQWYVVDGQGLTLGRLASEVATVLRGKHKPTYTPNVDCGDFVIIINAKDVVLTGNKLEQKQLRRHSRYPGGLKSTKYKDVIANNASIAVEVAVKGMLPHNRLGRQMYTKLNVYNGSEHPHQALLHRLHRLLWTGCRFSPVLSCNT